MTKVSFEMGGKSSLAKRKKAPSKDIGILPKFIGHEEECISILHRKSSLIDVHFLGFIL